MPSIFALIVLTAGLVLIHFGVADLENQLKLLVNPSPIPPPSYGPTGGLGY